MKDRKAPEHRLTTADLIRFMFAAFILGVAFSLLLVDAWKDFTPPSPKVGIAAARR
jgi:hypothetical protein